MTKRLHASAAVIALAVSTSLPAIAQEEQLTLKGALTMALSRSGDVAEARARSFSAEAEADAALGGYLPRLVARGNAGHVDSSHIPSPVAGEPATPGSATQTLDVTGSIRWTAYDFGRTSNAVGAARADARAADKRVVAAGNDVRGAVARAFVTAAFDELLVDNAKATVKIRERHAAITRGLVVSGIRASVEEARTRVELDLARLEVVQAERQQAQDYVRLATLLRLPPTTALRLVRPSVLPTIKDEPSRAAQRAEDQRPELAAAEEDIRAREHGVDAARAARYPTLGAAFDATQRYVTTDRGNTGFQPNAGWSAVATVTIPLFDWGVWRRVDVAKGELAAAEARRDGTQARVRGEAAEATIAVHASRALVTQSKAARELAGATLAVMEGRYQAGLATTTELFDTTAQEAETRRALIRAEIALADATIQALTATGRLDEITR